MKKLLGIGFGMVAGGLVLVFVATILMAYGFWRDTMLLASGLIIGAGCGLLALAQISERNPNILKEIEKLDQKEPGG